LGDCPPHDKPRGAHPPEENNLKSLQIPSSHPTLLVLSWHACTGDEYIEQYDLESMRHGGLACKLGRHLCISKLL